MKIFLLHEFITERRVNGKYVAEISLHNYGKKEFWLSEKQMSNLFKSLNGNRYSTKDNEVWCVLDGSRFVWSAINESGRKWLMEAFNVDSDSQSAY